ncbi:MAG TPA: ferrochelatase, partial [Burkholderiaceae bacterium]
KYAMRYGNPAIAAELDALMAAGVQRVLVLPAYPQYAAATTASVMDAVSAWTQKTRRLPELRFVNGYADDANYIKALADSVRSHWAREGRSERLVMSFHGLPARTVALGDPYYQQCLDTGQRLAAALGLSESEALTTFQSRFGRARWLTPYTVPTLRQLAADGVRSVDLICPGFAADCLETLEEIDQEAREEFIAAGGKDFAYIPCLNDSSGGMRVITALAERHLQGWTA